jgi:hypothetical protein
MKPKVYVETTVISYLTAWRSPQLVMAANQESTKVWWDDERPNFDLYVSAAVIEEASSGDADAAQRRLDAIKELPVLLVTDESHALAEKLIEKTPLPAKALVDALHIAIATLNGMKYLLTWNCRHIANATLRDSMAAVCEAENLKLPIICTPPELIGKDYDD